MIGIIKCWIFNSHDVKEFKETGQKNYRILMNGDYGDRYGCCTRCQRLVHGDFHEFGDGKWRRWK